MPKCSCAACDDGAIGAQARYLDREEEQPAKASQPEDAKAEEPAPSDDAAENPPTDEASTEAPPAEEAAQAESEGFGAPTVERYQGMIDCLNKLVDEEGIEALRSN